MGKRFALLQRVVVLLTVVPTSCFHSASATEQLEYRSTSGVVMTTISEGTGAMPHRNDAVQVRYTGKLLNGSVFEDRSATFPLDQLIPCWTEALQLMREGGHARLICPPQTAYGMRRLPGIPGGSTLVFDIELIAVKAMSPRTFAATNTAEEQIAKALAIVAGVWILKKVGDALAEANQAEVASPPTAPPCTFTVSRTEREGRSVEYECSTSATGWVRLEKDDHWYEVGPLGTIPSASRGKDLVKALRIVCGC